MPDGEVKWVKYKDRSLEVTRRTKPKFEEWSSLMETFNVMNESSPWWRGDLYNQGEIWFGEDLASSVFEDRTWNIKTWVNNASICRRIDSSRRRERLSYSHHCEVAYLEPEQFEDPPRTNSEDLQEYYLRIAEENNLTRNQLREKIKADRGDKAPPPKPLYDRLKNVKEKLYDWMDETEGDVRNLLVTAWESLDTAVEILKDE